MELEGGEFVVEFRVLDLRPVNQVQVLSWFDERKNFQTQGGENEVGVTGTVGGDFGQNGCEDEKRECHPPREGGVAHEPCEPYQEKEGK